MQRASTRIGGIRIVVAALATCLLFTVGLSPRRAEACGGFFCSIANPIDQAGERILFAVEGTTVTAIIQIMYQGDSKSFSWVLPLPSQPKLDVSNDIVFNALHRATDPVARIRWKNEDGCNYYNQCAWPMAADAGGGGGTRGGKGVEILDQGQVGPFDFKVLGAVDGETLFAWLNENGYDQPDAALPLVNTYVADDYVFVALKLQKDKEAGDIQPVVVTYEAPNLACVPLRLTAIAAKPDMPVYSWILGDARAVPMNYFNVVLNPKAFDFLNCAIDTDFGYGFPGQFGGVDCRKSYLDLVTAAANGANGHGFVTEFAGKSDVMAGLILDPSRYDLEKLAAITSPAQFLAEMLGQGFPRMALTQEIIRDWIPKPAEDKLPDGCKSDQEFYNFNTETCVQYMPEGWVFDPAGFAADLKERLLDPLEKTQKLFEKHPYLTRLFTTISPDEMSKDPLFAFNADLPDVSNVYTVDARPNCDTKGNVSSVTLTYEDGTSRTLKGSFDNCQWNPDPNQPPEVEPPVKEIQILTESGLPTLVAEGQVVAKDEELDAKFPELSGIRIPAGEPTKPTTPTTPSAKSGKSSGCAATPGSGGSSAPGAGWLLLAAGLLGLARRRRRVDAMT